MQLEYNMEYNGQNSSTYSQSPLPDSFGLGRNIIDLKNYIQVHIGIAYSFLSETECIYIPHNLDGYKPWMRNITGINDA
jgi:hypothetical protein